MSSPLESILAINILLEICPFHLSFQIIVNTWLILSYFHLCCISSILISKGGHKKVPATGWVKTTEMNCLTILEVRNLKSGCPLGESAPCLWPSFRRWLAMSGILWLVDTWLQSLPSSLHNVLLSVSLLFSSGHQS